jgi:hypothetical protein
MVIVLRNNPPDEQQPSAHTVTERPVSRVDFEMGITPEIQTLLTEICQKSPKVSGLTKSDEDIVAERMHDYRSLFDRQFDYSEYVTDPRISQIVRVLDFCYKVGFELDEHFNSQFYNKKTCEEIIAFFRNLFRLAVVELADYENLFGTMLPKCKIALVRGGNPQAVTAARDLSDKIILSSEDSPEHVQAAIVLLLQAVVEPKDQASGK